MKKKKPEQSKPRRATKTVVIRFRLPTALKRHLFSGDATPASEKIRAAIGKGIQRSRAVQAVPDVVKPSDSVFRFRAEPTLQKNLDRAAAKAGIGRSEFIRRAVIAEIVGRA